MVPPCPPPPPPGIGGTRRGRDSICEQGDSCPTLTSKVCVPTVHTVHKQCKQFPPEDPNQCVHLKVPSGTLT